MHFFRYVRRRVINGDGVGRRRRVDSQSWSCKRRKCLRCQKFIGEHQVDKPRPCNFYRRQHVGEVASSIKYLLGHFARLQTKRLRQSEGTVRLGIGAISRAHHGVAGCTRHSRESGRESFSDRKKWISHEVSILPCPIGRQRSISCAIDCKHA